MVGGWIIEFEGLEHDGCAGVLLDVVEAVVEHGEVAQPEEVHLQQAQRLASAHVELSDDRAVLLTTPYGNNIHQWFAGQYDARGVNTGLPL